MLIRSGDGGTDIRMLNYKSLEELLANPLEEAGVERFLDGYPGDPEYWEVGTALLLEVTVLVPDPVQVVTAWRLP